MTRIRSLAGGLLLLGMMSLVGCQDRKGDLGAVTQEEFPGYAEGQKSPALAGWLEEPKAKLAETAEVKPTQVAMVPAPAAEAVPVEPAQPAKPAETAEAAKPAETVNVEKAPAGETQGPPAPATPPGPTPPAPPVAETPEQRAERLLQDAKRFESVGDQARLTEAEAEFQAGLKLFNSCDFAEAKRHFENAARLNPAHPQVQDNLRKVRALLGVRLDMFSAKLASLEQAERVKIQEQVVVLVSALEEGRQYEEKGSEVAIEVADSGKEAILADQLGGLHQAQTRYRRVKEILNWMPPQVDLPNERRMVEEALGRIQKKIADKEDEISFLRRVQAAKLAEQQKLRDTELFKQRINKLLEEASALYDRGEYTACEKLAKRILTLDPLNGAADGWIKKARSANHVGQKVAIREAYDEALTTTWEAGEEAHIPYGDLLVYPASWDEIAKRTERAVIGKAKGEEQWKLDIRKRLQRRVSFEFVDTPLQEAISFLRSLTNVTMIIDPKVLEGGAPTINLRVTDMTLELALGWILKLAELDFALKDKAIFISKKTSLMEDVELRLYDVSDMTLIIQDMPGPELQLQTLDPSQDQAMGGGGAMANPFQAAAAAPTVTAANIADMIRLHVRPESWDPTQGTSIEERSGKLVVMQRPEVHALIDQLLTNFRATQKIMVNVEARFLQLNQANLEDIGVQFTGLQDTYPNTDNGLRGNFGDMTSLGGAAPSRPGWVSSPGNVNSIVGAITTADIGTAGGVGGDAVIGNTSQIRNGGLAATITVLSDPQFQAMIKALAARENTTVLMTPRLTVYNTQRAHMFVARQESYIADYDISGDAYDPVIRNVLAGVVLDLRPTVSSDRRYVTLEMRPTVTEVRITAPTRIIVPTFYQTGGVVVGYSVSLPIYFPQVDVRRVRTTATVPDGGILYLGGLYKNIKFHSETGVPFLSDLPVVGRLFRWDIVEHGRSNLAILVSPRIILFNEEEAKL
jgi:type II secretory pathway component GspD/PulD (secretin)